MKSKHVPLSYHPEKLKRELLPFYIGATDQEISEMLKIIGLKSLDELYSHISKDVIMEHIRMDNS